LLDKDRTGMIDVTDYVSTLSIVLLGTPEERIQCELYILGEFSENILILSVSFRLFDGDVDGFISKDEYEYALNLLQR
jgi:Ca2+-binding EF-hand superfamily protein